MRMFSFCFSFFFRFSCLHDVNSVVNCVLVAKGPQSTGEMIVSSPKYNVQETSISTYETRMTVTIRKFQREDIGSYRCIAKNSLGEVDSSIRLYGKWKINTIFHFFFSFFIVVEFIRCKIKLKKTFPQRKSLKMNFTFDGISTKCFRFRYRRFFHYFQAIQLYLIQLMYTSEINFNQEKM